MATFCKETPEDQHERLIRELRRDGFADDSVLEAMRRVPRHHLVPEQQRRAAYSNRPLPIGEGQMISQPYIVGLMTHLAAVEPSHRVLEVGTGSGYQCAILAQLAQEVCTIEIVETLALRAKSNLMKLGLADNVQFRHGDGYAGWPELAPFDSIVVTAAPAVIPPPLAEQLRIGGRLVIPLGESMQELRVLERREGGLVDRSVIPVRFVPMTGQALEVVRAG